MECEHRCIGLGLRWEPFEVVALASRVTGVLNEGFELRALERL
jgi:hypothetical protein